MSASRHTLLIPLTGPMQSWGYRSRFDDRDTGLEPTRSGVIGLLCAALGWPRERSLSAFTPLRLGVRVDAPGRVMTDYHTAQNVLRAGGGLAATVQSQRRYLADARFLVGVEGEDAAFLARLEAALRDPTWTLCLGRKSFPLAEPPYLPEGSVCAGSIEEAFRRVNWRAPRGWNAGQGEQSLRCVYEDGTGEIALMDAPRDFAARQFDLRRARQAALPVSELRVTGPEDKLCIFRD